jgi:hypothetical protein
MVAKNPKHSPNQSSLVPQESTTAAPPPPDAPGTALVPSPANPGIMVSDALSEYDLSTEEEAAFDSMTGLEEVDADDLRLGHWVFNMKREIVGQDGKRVLTKSDQFWNTQTDRLEDKLTLVFLALHKTRKWFYFDNDQDETIHVCRSNDTVRGTMLRAHGPKLTEGLERPCAGCPQSMWRTEPNARTGKIERILDCSRELNFLAIEPSSTDPCVIRFRRTSEKPAIDMLNKYFIGKRVTLAGRKNLPLYTTEIEITLKLSENGNFAVPEFRKVRLLSKAEAVRMLEQATFLSQYVTRAVETADRGEKKAGPEERGDDSADFDPNKIERDGRPEKSGNEKSAQASGEF